MKLWFFNWKPCLLNETYDLRKNLIEFQAETKQKFSVSLLCLFHANVSDALCIYFRRHLPPPSLLFTGESRRVDSWGAFNLETTKLEMTPDSLFDWSRARDTESVTYFSCLFAILIPRLFLCVMSWGAFSCHHHHWVWHKKRDCMEWTQSPKETTQVPANVEKVLSLTKSLLAKNLFVKDSEVKVLL